MFRLRETAVIRLHVSFFIFLKLEAWWWLSRAAETCRFQITTINVLYMDGLCYYYEHFSTSFLSNISYYKNNSARHYHKFKYVFMWSTCYSCQILMKLEFSLQNFEKKFDYQISWKSVQWKPSCSMRTDGRTDRETDNIKLKVAFRNFSTSPENDF